MHASGMLICMLLVSKTRFSISSFSVSKWYWGTPQTPAGGLRPPAPPAQEFPNYIVLFCTYYMSRSSGGFVTEYNTVVYSCVSRLGVAGARWIFVWRPQGSSLLY